MNRAPDKFKRRMLMSILLLLSAIAIFSTITVSRVAAQESAKAVLSPEQAGVMKFGLIAAAVAFGFGARGAGIAIANVGAAAMGAIAEKPEIAGQALIFIALAEGLVVFGFITALMILGKI